MKNFGSSMLWFWVGYIVVTLIGILHTVFNIYCLKMSPMDENSMVEGYEKTKPWHPLYNIIIFNLFRCADRRRSLGGHLHRFRPFRLGDHKAPVEPELQGLLY